MVKKHEPPCRAELNALLCIAAEARDKFGDMNIAITPDQLEKLVYEIIRLREEGNRSDSILVDDDLEINIIPVDPT